MELRPVVAPGFLVDPDVLRWLDGVMPAWTMLVAGDQLVAFYWRGDYKDLRRASAGKGTKRFAWENGEAR